MLGRPKSKNPKVKTTSVRFSLKEWGELREYCNEKNVSVAEAVRQGIRLLIKRGQRTLDRKSKS